MEKQAQPPPCLGAWGEPNSPWGGEPDSSQTSPPAHPQFLPLPEVLGKGRSSEIRIWDEMQDLETSQPQGQASAATSLKSPKWPKIHLQDLTHSRALTPGPQLLPAWFKPTTCGTLQQTWSEEDSHRLLLSFFWSHPGPAAAPKSFLTTAPRSRARAWKQRGFFGHLVALCWQKTAGCSMAQKGTTNTFGQNAHVTSP